MGIIGVIVGITVIMIIIALASIITEHMGMFA